jgi:hypothetical protein
VAWQPLRSSISGVAFTVAHRYGDELPTNPGLFGIPTMPEAPDVVASGCVRTAGTTGVILAGGFPDEGDEAPKSRSSDR